MKKSFITLTILLTVINSSIFSQVSNKKDNVRMNMKDVSGYGDVKWGARFSDAKERVIGKIVYHDDKKVIITRDEEIEYRYGFFFMDTSISSPEEEKSEKETTKPVESSLEAILFYVSIQFPYLTMVDVRKKIEEKYGQPTGETVKDSQGAIIWDFDKTAIIMWLDRYENNPFCRKINYVSKELADRKSVV